MSVEQVRVFSRFDDQRAEALVAEARRTLGVELGGLTTADVYYVETAEDRLPPEDAERLARELFSNPVTQTSQIGPRNNWEDPWVAEVAYRPGVQPPDAASIQKGAVLLGVSPDAVDLGVEYRFAPVTDPEVVKTVLRTLVVNDTVQIVRTEAPETLIFKGETPAIETIPIRDLTDQKLMDLSKERKLALNLSEMKINQAQARKIDRDLTDGELEAIAARRSDHCCHKTFGSELIVNGVPKAPLFARIKAFSRPYFTKRNVRSAFDDNSGVIGFYEGQAIGIKLETHISPFNLEPRGGAATGSGGVFRDIVGTGRGARPILSIDVWGMGRRSSKDDTPDNELTDEYLLSRGLDGVRGYGNPSGIPTGNGSVHEHKAYEGSKRLVLVGSIGIMHERDVPKGEPAHGDRVVAIGGRTGRDGIHGATFSSESMTGDTQALHANAVQIGDPIVQQKMFEALQEATEAGLIRAMTDCGAAGFSSAIGEMGEAIGVSVDIGLAPLKYEGLAPWEKWMSESQERMVAAISPANMSAFAAICQKYEVEMTNLGFFGTPAGEPRLQVMHGSEQLIDLDYDFLNDGFPPETHEAEWTPLDIVEVLPENVNCNEALEKVLAHTDVCSKQPIVRRFDHGVQGMHVIDPYGGRTGDSPSDASVLQHRCTANRTVS